MQIIISFFDSAYCIEVHRYCLYFFSLLVTKFDWNNLFVIQMHTIFFFSLVCGQKFFVYISAMIKKLLLYNSFRYIIFSKQTMLFFQCSHHFQCILLEAMETFRYHGWMMCKRLQQPLRMFPFLRSSAIWYSKWLKFWVFLSDTVWKWLNFFVYRQSEFETSVFFILFAIFAVAKMWLFSRMKTNCYSYIYFFAVWLEFYSHHLFRFIAIFCEYSETRKARENFNWTFIRWLANQTNNNNNVNIKEMVGLKYIYHLVRMK